MKKTFKFLTLAMMCALVLVGCKKAEENATNAKTFTVGFDAEFPPYGFLGEDGSYKGFDLDLAKEVCQRNGWMNAKNSTHGLPPMFRTSSLFLSRKIPASRPSLN